MSSDAREDPSSKLSETLWYASEMHKDQKRATATGEMPYIYHLIEVLYILMSAGITDEEILCGALLHDVLEDTVATFDEVRSIFGQNIASIVMECTDDPNLTPIEKKKAQLIGVYSLSFKAKLIKIGDKMSNLKGLILNPPITWSQDEIRGYCVWCWALCSKLYGLNTQLDGLMTETFSKCPISDVISNPGSIRAEVEKYYTNIKGSN